MNGLPLKWQRNHYLYVAAGLEGRKVTTDQRKWGGKRGKLLWQIVGN